MPLVPTGHQRPAQPSCDVSRVSIDDGCLRSVQRVADRHLTRACIDHPPGEFHTLDNQISA